MNEELTIIIPAKNEEKLIGKLLDSICRQDYDEIRRTPVILADAASTDTTAEIALSYSDRLPVRVLQRGLHCATTFLLSKEKTLVHNLMYGVNSLLQLGSKLSKPFSPGAFMLFDRERFEELGGFNEQVRYAEDYFLTHNVQRRRFGVVPGAIFTTNRRFKRMGHFCFIYLFLRTIANSGNDAFFFQDHHYWKY